MTIGTAVVGIPVTQSIGIGTAEADDWTRITLFGTGRAFTMRCLATTGSREALGPATAEAHSIAPTASRNKPRSWNHLLLVFMLS